MLVDALNGDIRQLMHAYSKQSSMCPPLCAGQLVCRRCMQLCVFCFVFVLRVTDANMTGLHVVPRSA